MIIIHVSREKNRETPIDIQLHRAREQDSPVGPVAIIVSIAQINFLLVISSMDFHRTAEISIRSDVC